eukprot:gene3977-4230_t
MRAYQKPPGTSLSDTSGGALAAAAFAADSLAEQRTKATLALLSNPDDNPTLIIRDKLDGEEEFVHASEPDEQGILPFDDEQQQPWGMAEAAATVQIKGAGAILSSAIASRASQGGIHRPGRSGKSFTSEASSNSGSQQPINGLRSSSKASGSFLHQSDNSVPEGRRGPLGEGRELNSSDTSGCGSGGGSVRQPPIARHSSSDELQLAKDEDAAAFASGQAVAEGRESQASEDAAAALAAAWNAARAAGPNSNSGWADSPRADSSGRPRSPVSASCDGQLQWQQQSGDGHVARQQTWMSASAQGAAAAAAALQSMQLQPQLPHCQAQNDHSTAVGNAGPAVAFLARFGYLVDDLVGDEQHIALQRVSNPILSFHLVSILQRTLTALFFGLYHFHFVSFVQVAVLILLHVSFVLYLLAVRPYSSQIQLMFDLLAYLCEVTVVAAAVMLRAQPGNEHLAKVLVVCYFIDVLVMIIPEVIRCLMLAWQWLKRGQSSNAETITGTGAGNK